MIGRGLFGFSMQLQGDIEGIAFVIGKGFGVRSRASVRVLRV